MVVPALARAQGRQYPVRGGDGPPRPARHRGADRRGLAVRARSGAARRPRDGVGIAGHLRMGGGALSRQAAVARRGDGAGARAGNQPRDARGLCRRAREATVRRRALSDPSGAGPRGRGRDRAHRRGLERRPTPVRRDIRGPVVPVRPLHHRRCDVRAGGLSPYHLWDRRRRRRRRLRGGGLSALPAFVEWHEAVRRERESGGE